MRHFCFALCVTMLGLTGTAAAQQARDDGGAARVQALVLQLTNERTQLQSQNADLKKQLDAANAELKRSRDDKASLERRVSQAEGSLNQATASNTRAAAAAEQQRGRMDELIKQFRETVESLRQTELERNDLRNKLATRDATLKTCATNNQKLFDTGNEVLDAYEQKGCFTSVREKEPFTQNKRVQLQNLIDEYRWKLEDQLLPASSTAPQAPVAGAAPAPANATAAH